MMEWERLINDYLDDALTPEETGKLFGWIHAHPDNARQFARAALLHRRLEHHLSAMRILQQDPGLTIPERHQPSDDATRSAIAPTEKPGQTPATGISVYKSRPLPALRRILGIAAALFVAIGVFAFLLRPGDSVAFLAAADNAKWGAGMATLKQGDYLPTSALVLDAGLIKVGFSNGNQLIIEGPARFSITDTRTIALERGKLTAIVTLAGRGIGVITPAARITDLGTEFGVKTSASATRISVFKGKVRLDGSAGMTPRELSAGREIEISSGSISDVPFEPAAFTRAITGDVQSLDLIDLIAGGDGTGSASGVGIDAANGRLRESGAVTVRLGNHRYLATSGHRVLDGCFIPDGNMQVDSAGDSFSFPATSLISYGLIWTGTNMPWEGERAIITTLPQDVAAPTSRVLVMHSNNAITLDLNAVRAIHAHRKITGFQARVGNSYRPTPPGASPARPLASIHVIVDGVARYEKLGFANTDAPIDLNCPISHEDHFLTLATTDGGDGNSCDWVLWTRPELLIRNSGG